MLKRYVPVATMAALLTGAATVAQPQTTTDTSATGSTTTTQTTPSASTPATNPGSTTTGTASDTSTGTQGMQGGFRGTTPGESTAAPATGTTSTDTSTYDTTRDAGTYDATRDTTRDTGTYDATRDTTRDTSGTSTTSGAGVSTTDADAATATSTTATGTTTGTAAATAATGSNALQGQDATFLRKAMEADRKEIAQAQAALDNAQRTDTKNAARMILDDHRQSSQKLQELASRKGWTLPSADTTAESDQSRMTTTGAGSGSFDDRFMADQIRMHREAIALYRAQASGGSDPDLRQFARDQLPHLEHHLEMLQGSHTQK